MNNFQFIAANEAASYKKRGTKFVNYKFTVLIDFEDSYFDYQINENEIKDWDHEILMNVNQEALYPMPSPFNYLKIFVLESIADNFVEVNQYNFFRNGQAIEIELSVKDKITWDFERLQQFFRDYIVCIECSNAPTEILYFGCLRCSEIDQYWRC